MKKIITIVLVCMLAVSSWAVSVSEVAGVFRGTLNVAGTNYSNKEVYVLPGVAANTVTLVIPSFSYSGSWGDLVLTNIPMTTTGSLSLNADLYIPSRSERATIVGSSCTLSSGAAQLSLTITTPTLSGGISASLSGTKVSDKNYALTNGGFEGSWSNYEPTGWHSFYTATGSMSSFASTNSQFSQATDVRPGSTGSHSALIQSRIVVGNKANGNCTNGQINAGSMTATDGSGNYNFSAPSNTGYNTPFVGQPDSMVFWAKYQPGGGEVSDDSNQARMHAVVTTNARYQDPEVQDYSAVKVADAAINYSATSNQDWQRIAVPFTYLLEPSKAAYIMITFSTNKTPAGGNSTKKSPDKVYLDDAEIIYNHSLTSLTMNGSAVSFSNGQATTSERFSDSDYTFAATSNGKGAKTFIGFDAATNQVLTYVVANNYSQAQDYSVYTLQMAEPIRDTYYTYTASTCAGEPYSDGLFTNLTQAGDYHTTIPNAAGHDSIITLTLTVLPTYTIPATATIDMDKAYNWRGHKYEHLTPGTYTYTDALKTKAGCDSIFTLTLTVKPIGYSFSETATACQGEDSQWHGKTLPTAQAGTFTVYDSLKSIYNTDSVYQLTLTVLPTYTIPATATIDMDKAYNWRGNEYKDLVPGTYNYTDELKTQAGCDSIFTLALTVKPIGYSFSETATACQNEDSQWHGKTLPTAQAGIFTIYDSLQSIYNTDSVFQLTLTVLPTWQKEETKYVNEADMVWHGQVIQGLAQSTIPYFFYDSLTAANGCDSVYVLRLFVSDIPVTEGEYEILLCEGEEEEFEGVIYNEPFYGDVRVSELNIYGGDSIVHLTVTLLPSYIIDEYMTIIVGDDAYWEGWNLSTIPEGQSELYASYYTIDDCDSTLVLHLNVEPQPIHTGLQDTTPTKRVARKVLYNGQLYIIREDETKYNILGTKIQ